MTGTEDMLLACGATYQKKKKNQRVHGYLNPSIRENGDESSNKIRIDQSKSCFGGLPSSILLGEAIPVVAASGGHPGISIK